MRPQEAILLFPVCLLFPLTGGLGFPHLLVPALRRALKGAAAEEGELERPFGSPSLSSLPLMSASSPAALLDFALRMRRRKPCGQSWNDNVGARR